MTNSKHRLYLSITDNIILTSREFPEYNIQPNIYFAKTNFKGRHNNLNRNFKWFVTNGTLNVKSISQGKLQTFKNNI